MDGFDVMLALDDTPTNGWDALTIAAFFALIAFIIYLSLKD